MDLSTARIGIVGSGSWATAIAKMVLINSERISWFFRNPEQIEKFRRIGHNPNYLTSVGFDTDRIDFSADINEVVENSDILIFANPSAFLIETIQGLTVPLKDKFIASAIKGLVPEHNLVVGSYFHKMHEVPLDQIAVISGPCHAEEVASDRLSTSPSPCQVPGAGADLSDPLRSA